MIGRAIGAAVARRSGLIRERDRDRDPRLLCRARSAMNQASFAPGRPVSAVPVLPATATPGIWAAVAGTASHGRAPSSP